MANHSNLPGINLAGSNLRTNNSVDYCRQIESMVNSRFIDSINDEYRYLFNLLPVAENPDTDIQRLLSARIGEYQAERHIRVKREFMMEHEVVMMSKFFVERVMERRVETEPNVLGELLNQINPNAQANVIQANHQDVNIYVNIGAVGAVNNIGGIAAAAIGEPMGEPMGEMALDAHVNNIAIDGNQVNNQVINDVDDEDVPELEDNIVEQIVNADLGVDLEQPFGGDAEIDHDDAMGVWIANNVEHQVDDDNHVNDFADEASNSDGEDDIIVNEINDDNELIDEIANELNDDNVDLPVDVAANEAPNEAPNEAVMPQFNFLQVREVLARGIGNDEDLAVIAEFKEYVRNLIMRVGGGPMEAGFGHYPPTTTPDRRNEMPTVADDNNTTDDVENNNTNDVITTIMELAQMELEFNHSDNIPVHIEFPKEPVDEGVLSWAGPNISNHSVGRYRAATTTVSIEAMLTAPGVYNIHGVELGRKAFIKLLMLLSPTLAYNLTHTKFVDQPLNLDLTAQLNTAFATNFADFYGSQSFSDCVLLISGYKFHTHKIILANESEMFRNYYEGAWGGAIDNITKPFVIEADPHLFGKLLDFTYTRKVACRNTAEVIDLYSIADAYGFKNLLNALDAVVNPVIMVAIRKRLYQGYTKVASVNNIPQPDELEPLDVSEASKMQEVD